MCSAFAEDEAVVNDIETGNVTENAGSNLLCPLISEQLDPSRTKQ